MRLSFRRRRGRHAAPPKRRPLLRLVVVAALVAAAVVAGRAEVANIFYVPSASMEPTLHGCPGCTDDRILVNELSYAFGSPARGDVVVFRATGDWATTGDEVLVKRVIAVGGDTVSCCGAAGAVEVNGKPVAEPYVHAPDHRTFAPVRVPAGQLWVMGDNRANSADSRDHGTVPVSAVIGRAVARVWPLARAGWLPGGAAAFRG